MLASLTGLLLTLGGDQPAVVFDPPLDPAIFDWDGTYLRVKEEALPLELTFPEAVPPFDQVQRMIFLETVKLFPLVDALDFSSGTGKESFPGLRIYDELYGGSLDTGTFRGAGIVPAGRVIVLAGVSSIRSPVVLFEKLDIGSSNDSDERITELEERVQVLEQSLESCQCASDLDGDGSVGFTDLVELISVWGPCSA